MQPVVLHVERSCGKHHKINTGKWSLKHFGPKIWDCIDPTLYELSSFTFKKCYRDNLIATYQA